MKRSFWRCATLGALVAFAARAFAAPSAFVETQTITIANADPFEDLGYSMAASNGLLLAGAINSKDASNADVGSAYVYRQQANGSLSQVAQLRPADGAHNDAFGKQVAIDGDNAILASSHTRAGFG